jgi:fructoselysine-6-P-deglycase FrlB-like protein
MAEIFDARKVILVGCGDSYGAAVAMAPVIEKYCDCFGVQVVRAIEFTRFLTRNQIGIGEPNSPLVIAISARGGTARICEVLQKANEIGAFSILLTNNPDSPAAAVAKRVYVVGTPAFPNDSPGLRSYFGSMVGMIAFASRMGHVRGTLPPTGPSKFQDAITAYVKSYEPILEDIDDRMFALAKKWKDCTRFDFIGDGVEYGSAFFSSAKFLECGGCTVSVDDSEDWCHINYFLKDPESIGTVIFADKNSPAFSRELETATSAVSIGRPVLVITNADAGLFPDGAEVVILPETPKGYEWLMPLMDYVPAALIAGYIAKLQNVPFFRSAILPDGTPDMSDPFTNRSCYTMANSKIEIYG